MPPRQVGNATHVEFQLPAYLRDSIKRKRELLRAMRDCAKAKEYDWSCGRAGLECDLSTAAAMMKATKSKIRYWKRKIQDSTFHNSTLGGARHRFDDEKERAVLSALKESVTTDPTRPVSFICSFILQRTGYSVSRTWVKDAIAAADWRYAILN